LIGVGAEGEADAEYFFAVVGPPGQLVPLVISGSGSTFVDLNQKGPPARATGSSSIFVTNGLLPVDPGLAQSARADFCSADDNHLGFFTCGTFPTAGSFKFNLNVLSDTFSASVLLDAQGSAVDGKFRASVDPVITFAPGFDSTGYSLVFSPSPSPAVPEPASLLFLGSSILGLVRMARRKRSDHNTTGR
jgi:hypothetical protein